MLKPAPATIETAELSCAKDDHAHMRTIYDNYGVAVIKNVFSKAEMNKLRSAALMSLVQTTDIMNAGFKFPPLEVGLFNGAPSPALIFWPSLGNKVMEEFRVDTRVQDVAQALLGPHIKQQNNQFYYRLPGDGDTFSWHQDIMFRSPRKNFPGVIEENGYLQTAIIVDKMGAHNGGVEFVLGSHKLGDLDLIDIKKAQQELRKFDRTHNAEKFSHLPTWIATAEPGDMMVWSALTVHGSEINASDSSRMYYMNGFIKGGCALTGPWYTKGGKLLPLVVSEIA